MPVQPLLAATTVTLVVLAPESYYRDYDLTVVGSALNNSLIQFGERKRVNLGFEFSQLGAGHEAGFPERTRSAVNNRRPVWVTAET